MASVNKPTAAARPGRPSIYTDALAVEICVRLACGESLRTICADESMPHRATVIRWLTNDDAFRGMYARAREVQAHAWFDEMIDLAKSEPSRDPVTGRYDPASVRHIRNQVATLRWLVQKLNPKRFGGRVA